VSREDRPRSRRALARAAGARRNGRKVNPASVQLRGPVRR
jgi:hypothetical protein